MKIIKLIIASILLTALAIEVSAKNLRTSVSLDIGTTGVGVSYSMNTPFYNAVNSSINSRFALNYADLVALAGLSETENYIATKIDSDGTVPEPSKRTSITKGNLALLSALFDWHPGKGGFRITLGVAYNATKIQQKVIMKNTAVKIDGIDTAVDLETNATITFNKVAPYFGIGYGNNMKAKRGMKFNFSIGVFYQGAPKLEITATGKDSASYASTLATKLEESRDNIKNSSYYKNVTMLPQIAFGIEYKM